MRNTTFSPEHYKAFCDFLNSACGIVLGANKEYLVSSRMRPVLERFELDGLEALLSRLRSGSAPLRQAVVDAMTTNETLWFRDAHPFKYFKDSLLDELYGSAKGRKVRIWSAACSSGQEPYSLSMCIAEHARLKPLQASRGVEIIATDISSSILAAAKKGEYDSLALNRGMPKDRLAAFFDDTGKGTWIVKPAIKNIIQFKPLNLQENYMALAGKLDMVFCRNVLIYFSAENKLDILNKIHSQLRPGGLLMLGASESIGAAGSKFEMFQYPGGIVYRAK
jgi:chemotaxis protein methyltransferase CheR